MHDHLQKHIYASVPNLEKKPSVSAPTARAALTELQQQLGIVKEVTGQQRNRVYVCEQCLDILRQGVDPIR